jgi:hypothetical protein
MGKAWHSSTWIRRLLTLLFTFDHSPPAAAVQQNQYSKNAALQPPVISEATMVEQRQDVGKTSDKVAALRASDCRAPGILQSVNHPYPLCPFQRGWETCAWPRWRCLQPHAGVGAFPHLDAFVGRMANRTLLLIGDSIQTQFFVSLTCQLQRAGLQLDSFEATWQRPDALRERCGGRNNCHYDTACAIFRLSNDDAQVRVCTCPAYRFEQNQDEPGDGQPVRDCLRRFSVKHDDVIVYGSIGLHYTGETQAPQTQVRVAQMNAVTTSARREATAVIGALQEVGSPLLIWREATAQHFDSPGGHFDHRSWNETAGRQRACVRHTDEDMRSHHVWNVAARPILERARVPLLKVWQGTAIAWADHLEQGDCTHWCPGAIDQWTPMLALELSRASAWLSMMESGASDVVVAAGKQTCVHAPEVEPEPDASGDAELTTAALAPLDSPRTVSVVLTGCIRPFIDTSRTIKLKGGMHQQRSEAERRRTYERSVRHWARSSSVPIVFADNSGADLQSLRDQVPRARQRTFEFLTVPNAGRTQDIGRLEALSILYTLRYSTVLAAHATRADDLIVSVTGRYAFAQPFDSLFARMCPGTPVLAFQNPPWDPPWRRQETSVLGFTRPMVLSLFDWVLQPESNSTKCSECHALKVVEQLKAVRGGELLARCACELQPMELFEPTVEGSTSITRTFV